MRPARAPRNNHIPAQSLPTSLGVLVAATLAMLAIAAGPVALAQASVTFGGNPTLAANAKGPNSGEPLTCGSGRPSAFFAFKGATSCAWWWTAGTNGRDFPFGAAGGSGTITSVTLPAMAKPGPMKVVIFGFREYRTDAPHAINEFLCCEVKELSQEFTPPANQEFTEPVDLPVSAQPSVTEPEQISNQDIAGISMLSGTESMPLAEIPSEPEHIRNAAYLYYPSPSGSGSACTTSCPLLSEIPATTVGYQLLAQFTLEPTSSSTGGGSTTPPATVTTSPLAPITPAPIAPAPPIAPVSPTGGLKLTSGSIGVPMSGKTAALGTASNPPTASTTQTITGVLPFAHSSAIAASKKKTSKKPKAVVLGSGSTTVAAGKTVAITLKLTSAASAALKAGKSLTVTEKITAMGASGLTATSTKTIVLKPTHSKPKGKSH